MHTHQRFSALKLGSVTVQRRWQTRLENVSRYGPCVTSRLCECFVGCRKKTIAESGFEPFKN